MVVECQIDLDNIVNSTIVFVHFPIFLEFQIADFVADPAPCLVNHPGVSITLYKLLFGQFAVNKK